MIMCGLEFLVFDEETVDSVGLLELLVSSHFYDPALRDDGDDVGLLDRAQTVGDDQHGSVFAHQVQSILK